MTDLVGSRITRFFRRTTSQQSAPSASSPTTEDVPPSPSQSQRKSSFPRLKKPLPRKGTSGEVPASPSDQQRRYSGGRNRHRQQPISSTATENTPTTPPPSALSPPEVTVQQPSPDNTKSLPSNRVSPFSPPPRPQQTPQTHHPQPPPTPQSRPVSPLSGTPLINEVDPHQSQASEHRASSIPTPVSKPDHKIQLPTRQDYFGDAIYDQPHEGMSRRKVWIKRPGQSATLVSITDEDVVDDIRDMVMRKYANSLGRTFDAPDVAVRIIPRERSHSSAERTLGPEEHVMSLLDSYFPGGQSVEEALIIDVPQRRTPRPSPRANTHHVSDETRPLENGNDYFPPMPASPGGGSHDNRHLQQQIPQTAAVHHHHSIGVLETGQLPPLPSPRGTKPPHHRPRIVRQHTSSPTIVTTSTGQQVVQHQSTHGHTPRHSRTRIDSGASLQTHPAPPPLPTPPASEQRDPLSNPSKVSTPPIDHRIASPRPTNKVKKPSRKQHSGDDLPPSSNPPNPPSTINNTADTTIPTARQGSIASTTPAHRFLASSLLDNSVPPINVLIVEDNIINLKLLEAFVKRLKVRWQTAMNGRDAVAKWREGGFHLVLMDIQLPIMSGLQATKEIRRLERVNGVGAFAKTEVEDAAAGAGLGIAAGANGSDTTIGAHKDSTDADADAASKPAGEPAGDDRLAKADLFKSPVIIVALTASSLQSDRREALAAGCNDFLTKPVNFLWLERKVMEWGCMQALIDYTGWRRWKDFAAEQEAKVQKEREGEDAEAKKKREKREKRKAELMEKMGRTAG